MTELEILDDKTLAKRWFIEGSPDAIARRLDRISNKRRVGHLKSFKSGNKRLYRLEDIREYEARAKHSTASLLFDGLTAFDFDVLAFAVGNDGEWLIGEES